jgi:hypothetical protein
MATNRILRQNEYIPIHSLLTLLTFFMFLSRPI